MKKYYWIISILVLIIIILSFGAYFLLINKPNSNFFEPWQNLIGLVGPKTLKPITVTPGKFPGINTTLPQWPVPKTLRVVNLKADDKYTIMSFASLQGLVNRQAPDGNMIYLNITGWPFSSADSDWLNYYQTKLNLNVIQEKPADILDWAIKNTNIKYYIIVDNSSQKGDFLNTTHAATINFAATMSGIFGNAIPVTPDKVSFLETHGYKLLPDSFASQLGAGGEKLAKPKAFDLRNQWQNNNSSGPWTTRQTAYRWALDTLLPLVDHHAITLNYESEGDFAPWLNDYVAGTKTFSFYFFPRPDNIPGNTNPQGGSMGDRFPNDYNFYKELLEKSGEFTMIRGWHWDEGDTIKLASENHSFHAGSKEMPNSSVHMALSQLFTEPLKQREVKPENVNLDPNKIYLSFTVSDGDQFGVSYNFYPFNANTKALWYDPARGQIPINWMMSGLLYEYGRGIERWFFDNSGPNNYFVASLPAGYGVFIQKYFGDSLKNIETMANYYLAKSGMPIAYFTEDYSKFQPSNDETVRSRVANLTNASAIIEGYAGTYMYTGIYWPEERPLMPYIKTLKTPGVAGYDGGKAETGAEVAAFIEKTANMVSWRPLFMHLNWVNWFTTPTDMLNCINTLNQDYPGKYELVGLPELVALAQQAKLTGKFPLEFYPHTAGEITGLEAPFIWENQGSTTIKPDKTKKATQPINLLDYIGRSTTGNNYVTYKFNVYPSDSASLSVEIEGSDYKIYASKDNLNWQVLITGSSTAKVTETADLNNFLNDHKSFYIKFAGEMKLSHVKITY